MGDRQLKLASRSRRPSVVLFLDLDGLKDINDRVGHEMGDSAIRETARLMTSAFRDVDILARLGGDEFAVVEIGIPEAIKYPEVPLLRSLYDDVLYRDIATRYHLEAVTALKELAFYLMSNPAGLVSFNKLKDQFHLGSVNTIKSYIDYMENSWLVFSLNRYDFSVKRQQIAPKKIEAGCSKW